MKKRNRNRLLALLLALMMVVSIVPTIAFTEAGTAETTETATEQEEAVPVDSTDDAAFATDEAPEDMALAPDEDNETITDDTEVVEPLPDTDTPDAETPDTNPLPDTETIPDTEDEAPAEPVEDDNPLKAVIEANGHTYVTAASNTPVYTTADMTEDGLVFTIMQNDAVLLVMVYEQDYGCVKVWLVKATTGWSRPSI